MGFFKKSRHSKKGTDEYILPIEEAEEPMLEYKIDPKKNSAQAPHALTAKEVLGSGSVAKKAQPIGMSGAKIPESPLDSLRKKVAAREEAVKQNEQSVTVTPQFAAPSSEPKENNENNSLLEKCKPFITEGGKSMPEEKPSYKLESVESILNLTEKKFSKIFDELDIDRSAVTYDALSKKSSEIKKEEPKPEPITQKTAEIPVEIPMERVELKPEPASTISDIDNAEDFRKTMPFTAIPARDKFEDISSGTKIIDLSSEMFEQPHESDKIENIPEYSDDAAFSYPDDYKSAADIKRVAGLLKKKRRNAFITAFLNIVLTGVLALSMIPDLRIALLNTASAFYISCLAVLLILSAINFGSFAAIKTLFTPRKDFNGAVGAAIIVTIVYSIFAVAFNSNPFDVIFTTAIVLCFKAIAEFLKNSAILKNFKIIALKGKKFGIKLISDKQTTYAMARNSIEGDVLAASSVETTNIQDFLKNTYSDTALGGALTKVLIAVLSVAAVVGLIVGVQFSSVVAAFEFAAFCVLCFVSPALAFTDALPFARAVKKAYKAGAMLTGIKGANSLDMANAVTLTSSQLFPEGTLSLHDIKVLDSNRIDSTLIDAAAITSAIDSPLKDIFNSIAKTRPTEIPKADTIKYEERLGISGWIDNRRIFIGNRTLLEAHGISTPPMEVDRKILRQGYFPVYLALDGKPCALLIVKYNVKREIAVRLQKLANIGVTFLIDSCDPNLTAEMVCDYFGLYSESVRVMGSLGSQLNRNATEKQEEFSSVAAHRGSAVGLLEIFCVAGKLKSSVNIGAILHIILSSILILFFAYSSLVGAVMPFGTLSIFVFGLIMLAVYLIYYFINRP